MRDMEEITNGKEILNSIDDAFDETDVLFVGGTKKSFVDDREKR